MRWPFLTPVALACRSSSSLVSLEMGAEICIARAIVFSSLSKINIDPRGAARQGEGEDTPRADMYQLYRAADRTSPPAPVIAQAGRTRGLKLIVRPKRPAWFIATVLKRYWSP